MSTAGSTQHTHQPSEEHKSTVHAVAFVDASWD